MAGGKEHISEIEGRGTDMSDTGWDYRSLSADEAWDAASFEQSARLKAARRVAEAPAKAVEVLCAEIDSATAETQEAEENAFAMLQSKIRAKCLSVATVETEKMTDYEDFALTVDDTLSVSDRTEVFFRIVGVSLESADRSERERVEELFVHHDQYRHLGRGTDNLLATVVAPAYAELGYHEAARQLAESVQSVPEFAWRSIVVFTRSENDLTELERTIKNLPEGSERDLGWWFAGIAAARAGFPEQARVFGTRIVDRARRTKGSRIIDNFIRKPASKKRKRLLGHL